jgi:hypothetical protein
VRKELVTMVILAQHSESSTLTSFFECTCSPRSGGKRPTCRGCW